MDERKYRVDLDNTSRAIFKTLLKDYMSSQSDRTSRKELMDECKYRVDLDNTSRAIFKTLVKDYGKQFHDQETVLQISG